MRAGIRIGEANNSFTGIDAGPTGVVISHSVFSGNAAHAVRNATAGTTVDATSNWWGSSVPVWASTVSGQVAYDPWFIDEGMTILSNVPPTTVYVDDDYAGTPPTDHNFGYDAFATIQEGITAVETGGTVNIAAGTYTENVVIDKSLNLAGAGAGTIIQPAISNPNCGDVGGGSLCAGSSNVILVQADNVVIHDLTVEGDNPALTSTYNVGGANLDARNGIITNHAAGVFNDLEVYNTTVRNIYLRGIYASSNGTFKFHDNTVTNVQAEYASIGIFAWYGPGIIANNTVSYANDAISANHSKGIQFLNNTVTHSGSGVHTDNSGDSAGSVADLIQGNHVSDCSTDGYGMWTFVNYLPVLVKNNTVTNCALGLSAWGTAPSVTTPALFEGNSVTGPNKAVGSVGAYLTTSGAGWGYYDLYANFSNNTFTNFEYGVQISSEETTWDPDPFVQKSIHTVLSHNQIYGNTNGADKGGSLNIDADLKEQWWGDASGPAGVGPGTGDTIGAGLSFLPWCTDAACTALSVLPVHNSTTDTYYITIQEAIDAASVGDTINVAAGTYDEDVTVSKSLSLIGEGASSTTVRGIIGGSTTTVQITASNVTIAGFTITRLGNNLTDWNNAGLNMAGIAIQGTAITGTNIHDNTFTGNRTAIDINNSSGHTIRDNVITDNRTGMIFRNQTDNMTVTGNRSQTTGRSVSSSWMPAVARTVRCRLP